MIRKKRIIQLSQWLAIGLLLFLLSESARAQVAGCRDPLATNYNPLATVSDGGCIYAVTPYTPALKVNLLDDTLMENSGLQMADNYLWSFNDGGGSAAIYRMDTISNLILQTVYLAGAVNIDWEDIAFDGTSFYVGDFGNNANGARTNLKIYKFPLRAIPDYTTNPVVIIPAGQIGVINFSYSDQPQPILPTSANNTRYDCEAMIVDGGKIHLFTKNWIDVSTTHYQIDGLTAGIYIATPLETLATGYLVTAADKVIGQKTVALLGYKNAGSAPHYIHLLTDYNSGKYFNGNKRRIDLPDVTVMGQAEGICFRTDTYGYISNEKFFRIVFPGFDIDVGPKLRSFDISGYVSNLTPIYIFTGNGNWDEANNWYNNKVPPSTINSGSEIVINPVPGGQCILNIAYILSPGAKLTVNAAKNFVIQDNLTIQ